jgi:4-hydroxy-3-methylbut-2-enyl diphosphate reductase
VTFLYIYAMHVLNRLFDKGASAYNDPERSAFLRKHRFFLILSGVLAIGAALVLCTTTGMITFFALCGFSLVGIIYSIQLFPEPLRQKTTYSKIKDIPGSKSLSEALAWTAVIAVLPFLEAHQVVWPTTTIAILIVLSISYIRSALFDIFQAQGDLIVGTETLPILLGEKKTLFLLKILLLCAAVILLGSPLFGLVTDYSYWMLLPLLTLGSCVLAYEKHWLYPGTNLEALVEGNFVLAGILAIIWEALP